MKLISRLHLRSPLARQFVLWTIVFSAILSAGITIVDVLNGVSSAKSATTEQHVALFDSYANAIANDLWAFDINDLSESIQGLTTVEQIDYSELVAGTVELSAGERDPADSVLETTFALFAPPEQSGRQIGEITMVRELRPIYLAQARAALGRLLVNLLKSSLIVAFSLFAFRAVVSRNLEHLAAFLRDNDPVGKPPTELALARSDFGYGGDDELDQIVDAVVVMNEDLRESALERRSLQMELLELEAARAAHETGMIVAHDVNNALTPPLAIVQMLQTEEHQEQRSSKLHAIEQSLIDVASIVNRLTLVNSTAPLEVQDLLQICEDVARLARFRSDQSTKDITLLASGSKVMMKCSKSDIRELLLNLAYNAIDAIPQKGTVELTCRQQANRVVLSVSDDGVGMNQKLIEACMDPLYTTKGSAGSGLGLPSTAKIVDFYGGTIDIESTENIGTTVSVSFPVRDATTS